MRNKFESLGYIKKLLEQNKCHFVEAVNCYVLNDPKPEVNWDTVHVATLNGAWSCWQEANAKYEPEWVYVSDRLPNDDDFNDRNQILCYTAFSFLGTPSVTVQTRDSFERGIRSLDASRAYHCWAKIPNVTFDDQFYIDVADRDYELNLEFSNKMGYKTLPNRIDVESMLRRRKNRNS